MKQVLVLVALAMGILLGYLSPCPRCNTPIPVQAQLPGRGGVLDVFVQVGGTAYQCYPVQHSTTEAPPLPERTATITPYPTNTPRPTATPEAVTLPTLDATSPPKPSVTPTPLSTPDETQAGCVGRVTSIAGLNARAAPSTNARVIGAFWFGQRIDLYAIAANGWFKTAYGGSEAFVYPAHVEPEQTAGCEALLD